MKGLMVSLIIVFFAGMTCTVVAAGQQAEQDAAKFEPRLGLQPLAAPTYDRPGPDDSDDDGAFPSSTSVLSQESTNTSSFGGQQYGVPAPESAMDDNIRFDVKVDENAIAMLRQGLKIVSEVDVVDQSTRSPLHPRVVSDIALFLEGNSGKNLVGVELLPEPMEPGSKTLRFEIPARDLDKIEQDAFTFRVPNDLRGAFNRVEFVKQSSPSGSHEFASDLTTGPRGYGNPEEISRSGGYTPPQPGPGFEPGEYGFTGPTISTSQREALRNREATLKPIRDFSQPGELTRRPLNTDSQFQFADRNPTEPTKNSFVLPRAQPEATRGQDTFRQNQNLNRQSAYNQPTAQAGSQESYNEQQLRQQLANAKAENDKLSQHADDWKQEAARIAKQRNALSEQVQSGSGAGLVQSVSTQPVNYRKQYAPDGTYLGRTIDAAKSMVQPFGSRKEDFGTRETAYSGMSQAEMDRELKITNLEKLRRNQELKNGELEQQNQQLRLALLDRRTQYQPTSFSGNDGNGGQKKPIGSAGNAGLPDQGASGPLLDQKKPGAKGAGTQPNRTPRDGPPEELGADKKGSPDLIWLLPLLLGSIGLNVFMWIHSRTLAMQYTDLADELRSMVGGATI